MPETTAIKPFGAALLSLGERYPKLVVIDADLQRATETGPFAQKFPERYFNVGVAEANMVGIAAGMALSGKTVFCGTFACFITQRVCDQVAISIAYCRANVKLFGFEPALYSGGNGATHQSMLDTAIMRAIPNMTVYDPGDATELNSLLEYLVNEPGPAYVRAPRGKAPVIFDPASYQFHPGKSTMLQDGKDATIIACGIMLPRAIQAAEKLSGQGISVRLLSMPGIKPLDEEAVIEAARQTGCIVVAENHNIIGGLGSAVAEAVTSRLPAPVIRVGIHDRFGENGTPEYLAAEFKIGPEHIIQAVNEAIALKDQTRRKP
jgi:transketolase